MIKTAGELITQAQKQIDCVNPVEAKSLFDSSDDNLKGGTGKSFDWNLIADIDSKNKIILSGGLNENNIVSAIENRNINFFDICSGVESSPGHKDIQKLKSIVNLVKS